MTLAAVLAAAGCAKALHEPSPLAQIAPGHGAGRSAQELMAEANAAYAERGRPGRAEQAQGAYLDAAVADPQGVEALLGAMRTMSFRIEREKAVQRGELAQRQVEVGQWCRRRAPGNAECAYRLAIALGQQARERKSTGKDALGIMVDLLREAIAKSPTLDHGGPHRVLALVLLRAPSWPVGPGDTDAALEEARKAVALGADVPENQLVLGEALHANDDDRAARAAYDRAIALATARRDAGDPDAEGWLEEAQRARAKL